jgi:phospholipid/cholesterol/gamma-HCH transport system substrate-binding protein
VKRAASALTVGFAIAIGVALGGAGGGSGSGGYRVDAIFDNASFLIPGQDVKIAGAKVGRVVDVTLTPEHKARIQMQIGGRFAPFRSDADCTIQPQSLIGEKFIQCTPGTPAGSPLRAIGDAAPTVPLANTHSPVDIDLVFATFRAPTNQRLAVLLDELGAGFAARGDDLNAAIRRANPALQQTRRVLGILSGDRARLRSLIGASDKVIARLARHRGSVKGFLRHGASVARVTASRSAQLEQTAQRLPALLGEAQPALSNLRTLAEQGTPILQDLRASAPQLRRLAHDAGPLADAARPALTRIGSAARTGAPALAAAAPVVKQLRAFARAALPTGVRVDQLFGSLRERGVVEGLQSFVYFAALATSRFDRYSHILPAHLIGTTCSQYATVTVPECSANFAGGGAKAKAKEKARHHRARHHRHQKSRAPAPRRQAPAGAGAQPGSGGNPIPQGPQIQVPGLPPVQLPPLPRNPLGGKGLLDYLLG